MDKKPLENVIFLPDDYMESICRICLGSGSEMANVFSSLVLEMSDEEDVKISDLAAFTLNLFIHPDDKLPKNACKPCIDSILEFRGFKLKAQEAERNLICSLEALEERLKAVEEELNDATEKEVKVEEIIPEEDAAENVEDVEHLQGISEFFCSKCGKYFQNQLQLESHIKYHESTRLVATYCTFSTCDSCHTVFLTEFQLSKHLAEFPEHLEAHQILEDCEYSCGVCAQKLPQIDELKMHVFQHSEKFICPVRACGWEYGTFARLSFHMRKKHVQKLEHKCEYCLVTFEDYTALRTHIRFKCAERKFKCSHCDKSFFNKKALQFHLKCANDKNFICEVCGKGFGYRGDLTIHMRTHTNERPFKCKICGKTYKTPSMRIAHMDVHIDGKTYPCDICGLRLQSKASFRGHMRRHKEYKQHGCDICGRLFNSKYRLKVHKVGFHKIMPSA
ncbi:zinc finger protein 26-like [Phlebotomus argentipes]|uniref:zinc finger protein 26-like n=1 Tax=Phlebotomus argentipes TaxID=94469 RepID=UPI002892B6C4|nr:zinc finger protein 26-like [Phlebotomus argentipes]